MDNITAIGISIVRGIYPLTKETNDDLPKMSPAGLVGVSFHSKCKVWGQRTDTVQQFKEPGQRSVPRIF